MENFKNKKSLSSSKKKTSRNKNNKSEIFKVYAAHPNINKNNKKQKLKISNTEKKRKDTYDYEFPEFSIVFRDNGKSSTFKSCINNQVNDSKVSQTKRSSAKKKTQKKNNTYENISKTRKQKPYKDISLLQQNFIAEGINEQKCSLQQQYTKSVQKVFHVLDIFNKGKISQANINQWVPEPALYFLGKIFQKIRNQRLSININQFDIMCSCLLYESNFEDIQWFIEEMSKVQNLKKSVNYQQKQQYQLSPIQKRTLEQEYIKSSSKLKLSYKNIPFEDVIQSIRAKQAQTNYKIQEVKQKKKSVTFHILEEKNLNCQPRPFYQDPSSKRLDKSFLNISSFDDNQQNTTPSKKSILKNSNKRKEEDKLERNNIDSEFKNVQLVNRGIANFTFQLPQVNDFINEKRYQNNGLNRQFQQIYSKYKVKLQNVTKFQENKPVSARYQSNYIQQNKTDSIIETHRITAEDDNKRLDQLRNRIQGFLKQNAQKIQKNKSFYLQSCYNP